MIISDQMRYVRFSASSSALIEPIESRGASSPPLISTPPPRWETYQGQSHLVIPVVALLGDIAIYPMGAECYELVPSHVLASAPLSWNNSPVLADHPNDGESGACTPEILSRDQFGCVFNSRYDDASRSLQMEAWLNPTRALAVGQDAIDVFDRCAAGEVLEISIGAYIRLIPAEGVARNGKRYQLAWTLIHPDHLAIGLKGKEGACSVDTGCGANRALELNQDGNENIDNKEIKMPDNKAVKKAATATGRSPLITQFLNSIRSLMSTTDRAHEAAELIGYELMKSMSGSVKSTMAEIDTLLDSLISEEMTNSTETLDSQIAENIMEDARLQAIRSHCFVAYSTIGAILDQAGMLRGEYFGYSAGDDAETETEDKLSARSNAGKRNSATDQATIQKVHDHAVSLGAACSPDNMPESDDMKKMSSSAQKSPCGCGKISNATDGKKEDDNMAVTKDEMKALLGRLLSGRGTPEDAVTIKTEWGVEVPTQAQIQAQQGQPQAQVVQAAQATPKEKTAEELEAEFLASAPPSVRDLVTRAKQAEAETRACMVRQLTSAQTHYNETALNGMSTDALTGLVKVLKLDTPQTSRVNFAGLGLPNPGNGTEDARALQVYGAPPSGIAEYAAATNGTNGTNGVKAN